jgi:hypothetical protein
MFIRTYVNADNATEKIRKDTNIIEKLIQELEEKKKNKKHFWRDDS